MPPRRPLSDLADTAVHEAAQVAPGGRRLLGITGPPGAGKSHAADLVAAAVGPAAVVAPMDGFHRDDTELAELGLTALKGVPASFGAAAFVSRLRQVRSDHHRSISWPTYDRSRQRVVAGGATIEPRHRLVVVEGNYLLLTEPPWDEVASLLDAVWYLDAPIELLRSRLLARHTEDRSPADAAAKVDSTDLPNAALIAATRDTADVVWFDPAHPS